MATVLVAGRVDGTSKAVADGVIRDSGLTSSDVIRIVWDNIAATGRVPEPVAAKRGVGEVMRRFDRLRAQTPRSDYLEGLTAEEVKDELSRR